MHKRVHDAKLVWILSLLFSIVLCGCAEQKKDTQGAGKQDSGLSQEVSDAPESAIVQQIRERGYLLAGCKTDVPGLSIYDEQTDTWTGLEIELAYQTAARAVWR